MKKLLTLDPTAIVSGLYTGVGKAATPLWDEGENIVFRDLGVRRIAGATPIMATPETSTIRAMLQGYSAGKQRQYIGTNTKLTLKERTAGVWAHTDLYTWQTASDYAQLETWGNWLVGTNNVDPPVVWKNAGSAAAILGIPFTRARILRRKSPYLLAFNTSNGEDKVEWCNTSNIEQWTPGAGGAGNNTLRDLESEIVAAEGLADNIGVYSTSSLAIGRYVGSPNWWGFKRAIKGIGAVSSKSVVEAGIFHYGMMQNGIFVTDGNSNKWIDDPAMQKWVIDTVNWDQAKYIWGFHDDYLRAVTWYFLNVDLQWQSISYHYDAKVFTKGNLQATAGAPRDSLAVPTIADLAARVNFWQQGNTFRGVDVPFSLKTKPLDFGARDFAKLLQLIKVDGEWDSEVRLRVGQTDNPESIVDWFHDQPMVQHNYFPEEREAPYFVVEFYGSKAAYITGIEFYGIPGGVIL